MNEFDDVLPDISMRHGLTKDNIAHVFTVMGSGISATDRVNDSSTVLSPNMSVDTPKPKPFDVIDELRSSVAKWLEEAITA